jgi:hypothetical protein
MRLIALSLVLVLPALAEFNDALYKSVSEKQARNLINSARVNGRVGGAFDLRVTSTDRSFNYKLRATWITQDVASALARVLVAAKGVPEEKALSVLRALDDDDWYYFFVELDPREGSGVIPKDWVARFGSPAEPGRAVVGEILPETEIWNLIASAFPRDYAYDVFLVRVAKKTGDRRTLENTDSKAELTVGIYNKVGHVHWSVPEDRR